MGERTLAGALHGVLSVAHTKNVSGSIIVYACAKTCRCGQLSVWPLGAASPRPARYETSHPILLRSHGPSPRGRVQPVASHHHRELRQFPPVPIMVADHANRHIGVKREVSEDQLY